MKIVIKAGIGEDVAAKRMLVAEVCRGVDKFLTAGEQFEISFDNDVVLTDLSNTLYSLAELVAGIAGIVAIGSDDEDYDPADFWKK
jgi:hypothetical protein